MQTLWCVLRKDTTGVDTARVRRRLNYKNTEVEFPESLAAVDITCRHNGLRCRYSGLGRRYKRLGLKFTCLERRYKRPDLKCTCLERRYKRSGFKCTCLERRYKSLCQLGVRTRSGAAVCDTKSHRGRGGA